MQISHESIVWLAARGFYGKTIAALVGCDVGTVYRAVKAEGFSMHTYRRGENREAQEVIRVNPYIKVRRARRVA